MDCRGETTCAQRTAKIAEFNDRLRQYCSAGQIYLTRAVASEPPHVILALFRALREFDAFNPANDPRGEHDMVELSVGSSKFWFKIDAFDMSLEQASPDAADETITYRTLTLMTAEDL